MRPLNSYNIQGFGVCMNDALTSYPKTPNHITHCRPAILGEPDLIHEMRLYCCPERALISLSGNVQSVYTESLIYQAEIL